jgi:RHO1 GDP-GTP exchange protein 1/2
MRRVLHLKQVTQCAMLEEFGIFLVLADKVCFLIATFLRAIW